MNNKKITTSKPIKEKTNSEKSDAESRLIVFSEKARYKINTAKRK
tara:strand:- start:2081 stop:2215 length:135 start_codon:yes stop_codon:yes gene_type:complete